MSGGASWGKVDRPTLAPEACMLLVRLIILAIGDNIIFPPMENIKDRENPGGRILDNAQGDGQTDKLICLSEEITETLTDLDKLHS